MRSPYAASHLRRVSTTAFLGAMQARKHERHDVAIVDLKPLTGSLLWRS
eukprot:CAMPEP_0184683302 /NCGR_PEP_ID=MMETSP0312-20130426/10691_1 /TAXON_ID=31354 /ORGANISM="Compsopogon coeruleus, Strain SAG 36.94" /LENGTH=48 /DNA_ID= /DNA_START= /DNA_END= /DNA_ORIENTATION=